MTRLMAIAALAAALTLTAPLRAEGFSATVGGGFGDDSGWNGTFSWWSDGDWGFGGHFEDTDQGDTLDPPIETQYDMLTLWLGWMSDEGWGLQGGFFRSQFANDAGGKFDNDGWWGRVFYAAPFPMGDDTQTGHWEIGAGWWTAEGQFTGPIDHDGNGLILDGKVWIPFGEGWGGFVKGNIGWAMDDLDGTPGSGMNTNPQRIEAGLTYQVAEHWYVWVSWREVEFDLDDPFFSPTSTAADGVWVGVHVKPGAFGSA